MNTLSRYCLLLTIYNVNGKFTCQAPSGRRPSIYNVNRKQEQKRRWYSRRAFVLLPHPVECERRGKTVFSFSAATSCSDLWWDIKFREQLTRVVGKTHYASPISCFTSNCPTWTASPRPKFLKCARTTVISLESFFFSFPIRFPLCSVSASNMGLSNALYKQLWQGWGEEDQSKTKRNDSLCKQLSVI